MARKQKIITPEEKERRRRGMSLFIIMASAIRDGVLPVAGAALVAMECVEPGSRRVARCAMRLKPSQVTQLLAAADEFRSASFEMRRAMVSGLWTGYGGKAEQGVVQELEALLRDEHLAKCQDGLSAEMAGQENGGANGWSDGRRAKQSAAIKTWRPWEKSTGPKTPGGKARSALNNVMREPRD